MFCKNFKWSNKTSSIKLKLSCMHHIFCEAVYIFIHRFYKIIISLYHSRCSYFITKLYNKAVFHVLLLNIQSIFHVVHTHLIMIHFMEFDNIGVALTGSQQVYFICAVNLPTHNFNCKFLSCLTVYAFTAH